uniref:S-locus receptor kinase C-terminal domain-containing protein n=1 Tax=Aegilops tauschii subsp. strangulata TaxID=200361 RepID=A0A453BCZ9_AEGTS
MWRDGRAFELVDPTLGHCSEVADIMRCVKVALLCVQDNAMDRPTMTDVTAMLGNDGVPLPDPRRPPHFHLRVTSDDEEDGAGGSGTRTRSTHFTGSCSTNDVTISTIEEGR